jgi:hypothetical protein
MAVDGSQVRMRLEGRIARYTTSTVGRHSRANSSSILAVRVQCSTLGSIRASPRSIDAACLGHLSSRSNCHQGQTCPKLFPLPHPNKSPACSQSLTRSNKLSRPFEVRHLDLSNGTFREFVNLRNQSITEGSSSRLLATGVYVMEPGVPLLLLRAV